MYLLGGIRTDLHYVKARLFTNKILYSTEEWNYQDKYLKKMNPV